MIRKPHVSMEFKRLSIPEKTVFGKNVYEKMLGNVGTFDKPDVPLDTMLEINKTLFEAAEAAKSGDFQKTAAMHEAEKTWDATYTTQAHYVDRVAKGSETIILLSGFKATKSETKPATQCAAATNLTAEPSNKMAGAVHIECDQIEGADAYIFIITNGQANLKFNGSQINLAANPQIVEAIVDTHRKVDFKDLPSGINYWVYVMGVNKVGYGVLSSPVGFKVLG